MTEVRGVQIMGKIGDQIIFSGCLLLHELFMAQHGGFCLYKLR